MYQYGPNVPFEKVPCVMDFLISESYVKYVPFEKFMYLLLNYYDSSHTFTYDC